VTRADLSAVASEIKYGRFRPLSNFRAGADSYRGIIHSFVSFENGVLTPFTILLWICNTALNCSSVILSAS